MHHLRARVWILLTCAVHASPLSHGSWAFRRRALVSCRTARTSGEAPHPQSGAPYVEALQQEARRVQAPFFFPGHSMGSGLATDDALYPLGSGARALLQVSVAFAEPTISFLCAWPMLLVVGSGSPNSELFPAGGNDARARVFLRPTGGFARAPGLGQRRRRRGR